MLKQQAEQSSHYHLQPTFKKLKNVDYYKHMKEKFHQKRAMAEEEQQVIREILDK